MFRLEDLKIGMRVNPKDLQNIYDVTIVLGDFDNTNSVGTIKYIGKSDTQEVLDICLKTNPRCVIYNTKDEEFCDYVN